MASELRAPRLTCRELVDLLTDYLEDARSPGERQRVEAHLNCARFVDQVRRTIAAIVAAFGNGGAVSLLW
ncbi:MAG: putative zinc-finger [Solirubrobacteraceae bacterium]|jgi:anti-sigma factor RsiW|nr:putative zinc-finger [Solirubrobacteraceae bacterium]